MGAHPVDVYVGTRLRMRRKVLGMSQEDLGQKVGVTFQQVQKYERGTNRIGSSRLHDFAQMLNVPVGFFFDGLVEEGNPSEDGLQESSAAPYEKESLSNKETMDLVKAFYRIQEPSVRVKVLSLIKALGT